MEADRPPPLHARVRWANVARAVGLAGLAGVVIAWPALNGRDPALPPADPVPVAPTTAPTPASEASTTPAETAAAKRKRVARARERARAARVARVRRRRREARIARHRKRRAAQRRHSAHARTHRIVPAPAPPSAPPTAPPAHPPAPAGGTAPEFGLG